jgi:hypothetical protein
MPCAPGHGRMDSFLKSYHHDVMSCNFFVSVDRYMLNEEAVVAATRDMGFEVRLLPFEMMTVYEQMEALQSIVVRGA